MKPKNVKRPALPSICSCEYTSSVTGAPADDGDLVRDAGRQHDLVAKTAGFEDDTIAVALDQRAGDPRKHQRTPRAVHAARSAIGERKRVGNVVGLRDDGETEKLHDHRFTCSLRALPFPTSARLTSACESVCNGDAVCAAGEHNTPRA